MNLSFKIYSPSKRFFLQDNNKHSGKTKCPHSCKTITLGYYELGN